MAGRASLNPDGFVLESERSTFVGVALRADDVLAGCGHRPRGRRSPRSAHLATLIVAAATLASGGVLAIVAVHMLTD